MASPPAREEGKLRVVLRADHANDTGQTMQRKCSCLLTTDSRRQNAQAGILIELKALGRAVGEVDHSGGHIAVGFWRKGYRKVVVVLQAQLFERCRIPLKSLLELALRVVDRHQRIARRQSWIGPERRRARSGG